MLLLAFALGLGLRFYRFGELPPGFYQDEGFNGLDALSVIHGARPIYFPANNGREPLYLYFAAFSVAVFGRSPAAEQGLLAPEAIDPATGYRYYAVQQLAQLNRILALKDLGFSLDEIHALLASPVEVEDLRRLLAQKRAEMDQLLRATQDRLARVESRLRQLEAMEANMANYDVVLKPITPQPFSPECEACLEMRAIREGEPRPEPPGTFRIKLDKESAPDRLKDDNLIYLRGPGSGAPPPGASGFPGNFSPSDDMVMLPFTAEHVQPEAEWGAQVVHVGDKDTVFAAHVALVKWIEQNGYVAVGHVQQTVLQSGDSSVIEIVIPVKRKG